MVLELQHVPLTHVSPGLHLFIGWHMQPSEPGIQSVISTAPEAPFELDRLVLRPAGRKLQLHGS